MTNTKQLVLMLAEDMAIGESVYHECPECGRADKLSVTRADEGILYHCFRDQCDTAGFIGNGRAAPNKHKRKKVRKARPYVHPLVPMSGIQRVRFAISNGLTRRDIERARWKWAPLAIAEDGKRHGDGYAFPVLDPRGYERGVMLRYYDGRPNKAIAYKDDPDAPWISWHVCNESFERVILVEDHVSAVKMSRHCTTVALLGTSMNEEEAAEIAAVRPGSVTIALDEDATNTAYKLKKWYGLLFPHCDVVHLTKDIKDMSTREIHETLGV